MLPIRPEDCKTYTEADKPLLEDFNELMCERFFTYPDVIDPLAEQREKRLKEISDKLGIGR